jgi:rod shape determining protein RodA
MIAVGSGGLLGRGFARGVVSQLQFLPERQTDFIFASLTEELGFIGATFLFLLLAFWFYRQIRVIDRARDNYGVFVAVGVFAYFLAQSSFNIAMNMGLMPITGVPLPLISYGGSSLLVSLVTIGILQSIVTRSQPVRFT